MKNLDLSTHGKMLSTRDLGKKIRETVEESLKKKEPINLSLEAIELMSSGFADELFGKLSINFPGDVIRQYLKVLYPKDEAMKALLRSLIAKAVIDRKNLQSSAG